MKDKEPKSVRFNQVEWDIFQLGEETILLQGPSSINIETIHQTAFSIKEILGDELKDIVPAYDSIAVFSPLKQKELIEKLRNSVFLDDHFSFQKKVIEIPICYEYDLDLDPLGEYVKLSREEIIAIHLADTYRSLFIGFTPGFIYADGLDHRLYCPRKSNPRTSVPSGSIGIGGEQTGIYSLESPGGWNIIGRTPVTLFDFELNPPMKIKVGTSFRFKRITKKEFIEWPG